MKQLSALVILFFLSLSLSAQESTSAIVKKWKLVEVEEFGEKYALTDAQKADFMEFTSDNKFHGLINGLAILNQIKLRQFFDKKTLTLKK